MFPGSCKELVVFIRSISLVVLLSSVFASVAAWGADPSPALHGRSNRHPSADYWLGGGGFWGNVSHWSDGIPQDQSAVYIGTGNDDVLLDINSNISALWLGGADGSSTLDDTPGQSLRIFGSVTVNTSGNLYLGNGATLNAIDIFNSGNIGVFTARDHLTATTMANYQGANFDIAFGHATVGSLDNSGRVSVHNGAASLNITGDYHSFGLTSVAFRGQMNVAGTLGNYLGATMQVSGQGASVNANELVNRGVLTQNWGNIATPTLVNSGTITADSLSKIQIGSGKANGPGYYQFSDGTMVEVIGADYFGSISIDGPAMLDGELDVLLDNGFIPLVGSTYTFLTFDPGNLSGKFSAIQDPYFNGGLEMWQLSYDNVSGYIQLVAVPTPEPTSLLLLGSGILGLGVRARRKRIKPE